MKHINKTLPILGWAVLFFVLASPETAAFQDPKLKVVTEIANIRRQPDIGSPILYQAEMNSLLDYLRRTGEWFEIRLQTNEGETLTGYVHESLVVELFLVPVEKKPKQEEQKETPVEKKKPPKIKIITPDEKQTQPQQPLVDVKPRPNPYYLSFKAGFHASRSGDLNTGAAGLADFYQDRLNAVNPIQPDLHHINYLFGADISFPLSSRLYLGVGGDYYSGNTGTDIKFGPQNNPVNISTRPGLQAVPVRFTADFFLIPALYVRAGVEYYFSSCSYYYRFSQGEFWQEWAGQAEAQSPGLLAGAGFTQNLTRFLDIFVEATGRYAKISQFKGTGTYQNSAGSSSEENGYLYIYQAQTGPKQTFDLLFIRDRKPSEAGVLNPEKAGVDFSGISVSFGLKLRF
jgi:hypothetical protein